MIRNTISFLEQLKSNNNRHWFNENKTKYLDVKNDLTALNNSIFNALRVSEHLDYVKMFRIYRDTRFSKNKEPYKNHIGIAFHRIKPHYRGGYYIHIEPGNSFLGAGFWDPNKEDLQRIRKEFEVDENDSYILNHNWHGNVRELRNLIERIAIFVAKYYIFISLMISFFS